MTQDQYDHARLRFLADEAHRNGGRIHVHGNSASVRIEIVGKDRRMERNLIGATLTAALDAGGCKQAAEPSKPLDFVIHDGRRETLS